MIEKKEMKENGASFFLFTKFVNNAIDCLQRIISVYE